MSFPAHLSPAALVQLPFPSQSEPLPILTAYYELYMREYQELFPAYRVNEGDLWEAPLWIAHLDGAIGRGNTVMVDASKAPYDAVTCAASIEQAVDNSHILFFSPLTQNFELAAAVSRILTAKGFRTIVGGNMASLASLHDFTWIYDGLVHPGLHDELLRAPAGGIITRPGVFGRQREPLKYRPRYRLLEHYGKRVPLVRLHGSHGCLFGCTFCGDSWTKQLHVVDREYLREEIDEIRSVFPETRIIYIGDKTFGQSPQSVENLLTVLKPEYGFELIVQTHVSMVDDWLMDAMNQLNVKVVEIGFETVNATVLKGLRKDRSNLHDGFTRRLEKLRSRGFLPVLNVLGGLPNETSASERETLQFLQENRDYVWLYNLYNFVPYPKAPLFEVVRNRIVDWNFQNWREDRPPVFEPFYQTRDESWDHFLQVVATCTSLLSRRRGSATDFPAKERIYAD